MRDYDYLTVQARIRHEAITRQYDQTERRILLLCALACLLVAILIGLTIYG